MAGNNLPSIKPIDDKLPANPNPWISPNKHVTAIVRVKSEYFEASLK